MHIAIIGTGNVGGALATQWARKGHHIHLGVQDTNKFKGQGLMELPNIDVQYIREAVGKSEVVLIATPPVAIFDIIDQMGDVSGKVIIDATNSVMKKPDPYPTVFHALSDKTSGEIVKCFNTTGYENMLNPIYDEVGIEMFMSGDSVRAKDTARQLALDCGFSDCLDFGQSDKVVLQEHLALSWINLAIMQGHGRGMAFKVVKRA